MKKLDKNLSEIFDIEPMDVSETPKKDVIGTKTNEISETPKDDVVESDTEFARQNIRELLEKGGHAVDELAAVARDSQHPRAYEVMATLIKNLSDLNKDLLEIQKRKKDLNAEDKNSAKNINVDKAVFIGSTADLIKQIKANK